ncbi:6-bladed beta-propeller [Prolixibacter denitrificans]|uniref:6-bladed beta-propeller protein n=1 Tax=Prolixibacter denitrificans TaxID=1541063 RepID=A0A2P8CBW9_9BACT|nr:6-bladed beta-propeller [Prolixibacter denitrificans]PSK82478.1 6-bladed beta-propeller protein [Prolixibacter denitrificans]GET22778.1 hypothetical protein JCM18694_30240 [Prolixibacter denitrificans]
MKKRHFPIQFSLLLALLVITTFSCQENTKKENSGSFYTIPFADIIGHQQEVKLSELASDVQFVQLENAKDALLGHFENIELTKNYIFVMCWKQPILQFSRSGKFIKDIGRIGKGPDEYTACMKMSVDEKNKRIYLQIADQGKMMVLNFDGKYVRTIANPAMESFINFWTWSRDSMQVSYFEPVIGNERFVFIEHNEKGDTLQGVPNHNFRSANEQADPFRTLPYKEQNFTYRFENKLHMKGNYNDTVYSYDENNHIVPKFFIDLGKHKLPADLIYERKWTRPMPGDLCWVGVHETNRYVFIPYGYHFDPNKPKTKNENLAYVLYDKQTQKGVAIKETKQGGFINDITGGPDFRPTYTNDSTAVMLVSALDMKQYLESDAFKNQEVKFPERKKKLEELSKTIKEDDNTILVVAKVK